MTVEDLGFEPIEGRAVLLTGASSGIGRAAAVLLARGGVRLGLMARRKERLEILARQIAGSGWGSPLVLVGDVRQEQDCTGAVERFLERFGRIDALINNAGVGYPTDLASVSTEAYRAIMQTNVDGVFFMTRAVVQAMIRQKAGDIIMISSSAGRISNPTAPIYCSSKFALEGYTDGLRMQLDRLQEEGVRIRVMTILPGMTDSDYWGDRAVPRERFMSCEEMAAIVVRAIATRRTVLVRSCQVEPSRLPQD
ncbi:MAG: hypothetical protein A2177_16320 [Spirochaetes bacterium RBG_13_68_11]|nr:MAG: hypothetical protein A2177_16320 [Spirochaetes bacterium RBG_13_68_11]